MTEITFQVLPRGLTGRDMELEGNESELEYPGGWRQEWDVAVYLLGQVDSRQAEV